MDIYESQKLGNLDEKAVFRVFFCLVESLLLNIIRWLGGKDGSALNSLIWAHYYADSGQDVVLSSSGQP